ncbi:MAG: 16S rRNA (guanine(966)-N(2))-methyltransferase RsmD [Eubacteriales bacterium]|nr:16S rRNA (guanine(966)-N(2))-methyltransferase RsmD [Eubacteriales bacterium]MDD4390150.1 16S rRNA (guanine(966)-N(2))-methyltransferase RsmD [Eubacteriales bacterium]
MRIIAGNYKGRQLLAPSDNKVRPTTDKVKEAIFSIITPYINDSTVIDLFAGTGNLGLEALSRGAARAYFGDNSKSSISLIKKNIETCKAEDKSIVFFGDYSYFLSKIKEKVDIIFIDPPYGKDLIEDCFSHIQKNELLDEDGIIVTEHGKRESLPNTLSGFYKLKERTYSRITVSIYALKI